MKLLILIAIVGYAVVWYRSQSGCQDCGWLFPCRDCEEKLNRIDKDIDRVK